MYTLLRTLPLFFPLGSWHCELLFSLPLTPTPVPRSRQLTRTSTHQTNLGRQPALGPTPLYGPGAPTFLSLVMLAWRAGRMGI